MNDRRAREEAGVALTARACALVALATPILWQRSEPLVVALAGIASIWIFVSLLLRVAVPIFAIIAVESCTVAIVCALSLPAGDALLPSLALAPFIAGLWRGGRGVFLSLGLQIATMGVIDWVADYSPSSETITTAFTWLVTGMGFGLVASFFHARAAADRDDIGSYRQARALLRDLVQLSGRLDSGLDSTVLGGIILDQVSATIPNESCAIFVEGQGDVVRLVAGSEPDCSERDSIHELVQAALSSGVLQQDGAHFAVPLQVSGQPVAAVGGRLSPGLLTDGTELGELLAALTKRLEPVTVRLDTAMLFAQFRDGTMSEERRRIAREMHDGVAQDVASMGYLVDALTASATPGQLESLQQLRTMISDVVSEVRRSVMALRTQAGQNESLGAAIAALARQLSDASGVAISVTTDERTSRLRHEVEAELLRITQEAMNNALKHAHATRIDVHCRVDAPRAEISVRDDGRGLGERRHDSHGMSIMRERATLIGAELDIGSAAGGGTAITVHLSTNELVSATEETLS